MGEGEGKRGREKGGGKRGEGDHRRHPEGSACSSVRWALPAPPGPLLQGLGEDEKASSQGGHPPHRAALVQGYLFICLSVYSLEPGALLQHLSTHWLGGVCFFHRPAQGWAKASVGQHLLSAGMASVLLSCRH